MRKLKTYDVTLAMYKVPMKLSYNLVLIYGDTQSHRKLLVSIKIPSFSTELADTFLDLINNYKCREIYDYSVHYEFI